jgi:hypothetical protein
VLSDQEIFALQVRTYLSTKLTEVLGVLTDLHLLNLFPQTGTIPCACLHRSLFIMRKENSTPHCHMKKFIYLVQQKTYSKQLPLEGYT